MRRTLSFCEWKASWWDERRQARALTVVPFHVAEGVAAYAAEQAEAERQRALQWALRWTEIRQRAATVLHKHLNDSEPEDSVPMLMDTFGIDTEDDGLNSDFDF
jgi:hypothetical protein